MISEEQAFQRMSPVDQLRVPSPRVPPEEAAANRQRNARDLLSVTPVVGNVLAAQDAWDSAKSVGAATTDKERKIGMAGTILNTFGALSPLPWSRTAGNAARGAKDSAAAFPAWHGSPHDFDEFKLDKIGTGEGAQAYGHGLYFAENPKTAISYRDALEKKHQLNPQQGNLGDIRSAVDWLKSGRKGDAPSASGQHIDDAISDLRSDYVNGPFPNPTDAQIATHLEGNFTPRGRLYKTEIDAEPHQLLDWDKPLNQQSPEVMAALQKVAWVPQNLAEWKPGEYLNRLRIELVRKAGESPALARRNNDSAYAGAATVESQMHHASKALREAGIPGIRYADQGSRGSGGGTSNYVIFDDKLTKILSKE